MSRMTFQNLDRFFLVLIPIGIIVSVLGFLVFQPWGSSLGVPFSADRLIAGYVIIYGFVVPPSLFFVAWQMKHSKWLARVGQYMEGMKVNPVSPYHLAAMGIVAALYATSGFTTPFNIDLASFTAAFSAVFFGPWITLVGLFVGNVLRWLNGTAWWLNPTNVALNGYMDAAIWAINGGLYLLMVRNRQCIRNPVLRFAVMYLIFVLVHGFMTVGVFSFIFYPFEGAVQYVAATLTSWYPGALVFSSVGLYVGETMYQLVTTPQRATAPPPPTHT